MSEYEAKRPISRIEREYLELHVAKAGPCGCQTEGAKWQVWSYAPMIMRTIEPNENACVKWSWNHVIVAGCTGCHQLRYFSAHPLLEAQSE